MRSTTGITSHVIAETSNSKNNFCAPGTALWLCDDSSADIAIKPQKQKAVHVAMNGFPGGQLPS